MKFVIALFSILFTCQCQATELFTKSKFSLVCSAVKYKVNSDLTKSLLLSEVRSVTPALAQFLNSSTYSTNLAYACKNGECSLDDNVDVRRGKLACKSPKEHFRIKSIKNDNSTIMIENRCDGGFSKYQVITDNSTNSNELLYMDERMKFRLKNQIFRDGNSFNSKPVVAIKKVDDMITISLTPLGQSDSYELISDCSLK